MAGRGTDILLGGNPEGLAARYVNERCFTLSDVAALVQLVVEGKASEAQQLVAKKGTALTQETLIWAEQVHRTFAQRAEAVDQRGIVPVIVPEVLGAFGASEGQLDREAYAQAVRTMVNAVRRGRLLTAREQAERMHLPPEQIDWIVKWLQDLGDYRRRTVAFLAGELFNRHYNARMALVRDALAGRVDAARKIAAETPDLGPELLQGVLDIQKEWAEKRRQVWALGGIHIVGTERYEARRIDDQFRGRAARQGDPGTSRFYLSLEDELMRRFASDMVSGLMERFSDEGDIPLEAKVLTRAVESAQRRLEGYYFDMRKHLVEYDEVVSRQRELIYEERRAILSGSLADLREHIREYFEQEIDRLAGQFLAEPEAWFRGEITSAIADYSNLEVDEGAVNAPGVMRRLQGLLPALAPDDAANQPLQEQLALIEDAEVLQEELEILAEQAIAAQRHVQLFIRSVAARIPLMPPVDFVYAGNKHAQWYTIQNQHAVNQEALGFQTRTLVNMDSSVTVAECAATYRTRVSDYLDALVGSTDSAALRTTLEQQIDATLSEVFESLSALATRTSSKREQEPHLAAARQQLAAGFEDMLTELFRSLPVEGATQALMAYYDRAVAAWEAHIAHRTMRGFLGQFQFTAADREEERLMRGPAQVEQNLSRA
ncbi:MAG: hypothetical protein JXD18_00660, partial [Anaerolineae bacterium]|nr:hypothetical protein [Anaerolineae bacterium]